MRTIYLAQKNGDSVEGRGPMITIAAFDREADAITASKGYGVMGVGDGEVLPLKVFSSFAEYNDEHQQKVKDNALRKLSKEERRVLGL